MVPKWWRGDREEDRVNSGDREGKGWGVLRHESGRIVGSGGERRRLGERERKSNLVGEGRMKGLLVFDHHVWKEREMRRGKERERAFSSSPL